MFIKDSKSENIVLNCWSDSIFVKTQIFLCEFENTAAAFSLEMCAKLCPYSTVVEKNTSSVALVFLFNKKLNENHVNRFVHAINH